MCKICDKIKKTKEILKETDSFIIFKDDDIVIAAAKKHSSEFDIRLTNYLVNSLLYALSRDFKSTWDVKNIKDDHFHFKATTEKIIIKEK